MDSERLAQEPAYRGTEVPLPIRWGEPAPPPVSPHQKAVIVVAACVGFFLLVAVMVELLF